MNTTLKKNLPLLTLMIALLSAPALRAQVSFDVTLNTTALSAQDGVNTPFYLDFQLNYGSTPETTSSVTLSSFQFIGGGALGSATTNGTASGSVTSTVSLTANSSSQFNELYQQFSSSTTDIIFLATVSGASSGAIPTEFTTAILDNSLGFPAQLYTTAPDTESLVTLNLNPSNTLSSVGAFTSLSSADGLTTVTGVGAAITVPEPSTTAAIMGCAALLVVCYVRRSRKLQLA